MILRGKVIADIENRKGQLLERQIFPWDDFLSPDSIESQVLIQEGRIWDYKDWISENFCCSGCGWGESHDISRIKLDAIWSQWYQATYDESTYLGLISIFTDFILKRGWEDDHVIKNYALGKATRLVQQIVTVNSNLMRSRPYASWLLAKAYVAICKAIGSFSQLTVGQGHLPGTYFQSRAALLPLYIPWDDENPGWKQCVVDPAVEKTLEKAIALSQQLCDYASEITARQLKILISTNPAQEMNILSQLQFRAQGDIFGAVATLLSKYLVCLTDETRLELLHELETLDYNYIRPGFYPALAGIREMIIRALTPERERWHGRRNEVVPTWVEIPDWMEGKLDHRLFINYSSLPRRSSQDHFDEDRDVRFAHYPNISRTENRSISNEDGSMSVNFDKKLNYHAKLQSDRSISRSFRKMPFRSAMKTNKLQIPLDQRSEESISSNVQIGHGESKECYEGKLLQVPTPPLYRGHNLSITKTGDMKFREKKPVGSIYKKTFQHDHSDCPGKIAETKLYMASKCYTKDKNIDTAEKMPDIASRIGNPDQNSSSSRASWQNNMQSDQDYRTWTHACGAAMEYSAETPEQHHFTSSESEKNIHTAEKRGIRLKNPKNATVEDCDESDSNNNLDQDLATRTPNISISTEYMKRHKLKPPTDPLISNNQELERQDNPTMIFRGPEKQELDPDRENESLVSIEIPSYWNKKMTGPLQRRSHLSDWFHHTRK